MAVRSESVRLSLDDQFSSGMARAAAATAILGKELKGLDGSKVSTGLNETSDSVDKVGNSSRRSSPEIDKLSGRLRLLTDAAVTIGPALIPLAAGSLPLLTGALAGLGAAAGGIGVTVLAFQGLGDALKALNTYQLEPTAQNLQALRIEQEKLGPSGTQFLRYIDSLEPALKDLQNTARAGIFPGVEQGIDDLLTRLPQVRTVIASLSDGIGEIAASAGASLGGDDFDGFFSYLETDARPTLEAFARSAGNVALGVANLLTAFAPLNRDFTSGLESLTKRFADFSKGLDDNSGFQSFVEYVRKSGPQVVAFAAQTAKAFAGIAEAAAPVGSAVLPILTQMARVLAIIASSPIGPALFSGIAAFTAINRVGSITATALDRLSVSGDKTRASFTKFAAVTAGAFAGLELGASGIRAIQQATDDVLPGINQLTLALLQLSSGQSSDIGSQFDDIADSIDRVAEKTGGQAFTDALQTPFKGLFGEAGSLRQAHAEIDALDQSLAQIAAQGSPAQAAAALEALASSAGLTDRQFNDLKNSLPKYQDAVAGVASQSELAGGATDYLNGVIQNLAHGAFADATNAAQNFSAALAELNGWFDKRDALRAYGDSLDTLSQSLKNGFSREDEANLDAVGRSIIQVANNIKNPGTRANFLANAREQLESMAKTAAPQAKKAIQEVIDKFDSKGLTNPPPIKLSADDKAAEAAFTRTRRAAAQLSKTKAEPKVTADTAPAIQNFNQVDGRLDDLNGFTARTRVTADTSAAQAAISSVRSLLLGLNGTTATTYVRSIRVAERNAEGGYISGPGGPKDDAIPSWLSNGEYVMPAASVQKYGVGTFDKMRALRFAEGGPVPGGSSYADGDDPGGIKGAAKGAAGALKVLEVRARRLEAAQGKQEKKLDNLNQTLDNLTSARDSLSSSTTSALTRDPFGNGLAGLQAQTAADTSDGSAMLTALKTLIGEGIDPKGALFQQLAASGDVTTAQQLAALSAPDALAQQAAFQQRVTVTSQVGQYAGQQSFGPDIKLQTKAVNEQRDVVRALNQTVRGVNQEIKHLKEEISRMKKYVKDGAKEGTREGQQDKDRTTHQNRRTGNR